MSTEFIPTRLPEVVLIKPRIFGDQRGFFLETWQHERFAAVGITGPFVQDNHSHSSQHTLRGLHFQVEQTQGKLVRVTRGSVYDVAVDMRRSSPRFGQWVGLELNANTHEMLWVPPGFAHGYLTLSERAVRWDDAQLQIPWPLPEGVAPLLSAKDAVAPLFADAETFP